MNTLDEKFKKNNLWDNNDMNINEENVNLIYNNEQESLLKNEFNDNIYINEYSRRNNVNIYYDNENVNNKCEMNDNHLNKNLDTSNINVIKKGYDYNTHLTNVNNSINFSDININNKLNNANTPNNSHKSEFFEKEFNLNDEENNYKDNIDGKMNIINSNTNINNKDNSFELFPFFKSLNNIRTKLLCYYDIDNDVIIYRCMCALLPYLNVDRTYEEINNFNDIEKNVNETDYEKNTDKTINQNENENKREISNVNDAFDYYDNKLCIERNPDIYSFIWLNSFVCFLVFFLFNMKNLFFNDISLDEVEDNIKKTNYIVDNKLNILYIILIFVFLFNTFIPILIYTIVYLITKKKCPFKLLFLISLVSYNNINLLPVLFIYKITNIETNIIFLHFLYKTIHLLVFLFYICTTTFYIYKFTNKIFKNHFSDDLIYLIYTTFLISYIFFYFLLKSYIFNYL
ncbi:conserved Plasmodium membrane protein, unknown function [Plasmodium gallinaceum]|uniref:Uncharacterized protein n=1 Tax=Plasmodium gallinaceum TaxID=5849 RepID=A0A1J1GQB0_PLAGA|nr:conserved Plasmodium membrane protein, unknown function [Plasmodium gallinaceum]CRG93226.1 conserved Plasmodium membrane protein, unknown function [Plasmodium gallinaceum]